MRRRITLVILATVAVTLVLTGLGTVVLARAGARHSTETQVRDEVDLVAATASGARPSGLVTVVTVAPDGTVTGDLPRGVDPADVRPAARDEDRTITGSSGNTVWAARAVADEGGTVSVVVSARPIENIGGALPWFLLSSAVALLIAVVAATVISRRLVAPVRDVTVVTARIAGGDLAARLPEPAVPQDEIDELAGAVNAMAAALEQSRGLERQFLLSVSHDLRTPLTSIRGYAEAITDGAVADPREAAAIILSESRRLERLVADLLELGMLDARQFTFHPRAVDLREVAGDVVDGVRHGGSAITVAVAAGPDPVPVTVDPDRLQQAVANLIENARREARSSVRVEVVAERDWAHLSVIDDGPGIDAATLPHVFERAFSGRGSSGLGLAIVRELVAAMGGRVEARNEPDGAGARLLISLPVSRPGGP